ncbi:flavin reductase family protein [Amycolatopsis thermophila]|uniref:Flavin reductase (DIM6/NTAB) family NADH-FMN oxidoreductase RutF n=1 Tax=Amycolatopsis thermophila TaxID=206084 RepID=A0ABU0F444_9PSEU|nr:flavin reductase family protein [Amycolatopsis thermophila]MDQ0382301.1 flavin reductase (DIM6/NTAB) family NADH-FMN oxidoreductase RutF [Amycolatopsis thermophila]
MDTTISPSLAEDFREVMARVCTPVSVVTTLDGQRPHGTTVSAFSSLSLRPPMVLVALDRASDLLALVRDTGRFGLNVLGSGQAGLAVRFAGKGRDKFDGVPWRPEHGVPRLPDTAGFLACAVDSLVAGGDHMIVLGRVLGAGRGEVPPLTYHARSFGTHTAVGGEAA